MTDQVSSLTTEPAIFQLGLPPGNGSTSCTDCCVAMIIRHEKGHAVTAAQVRKASGNTDVNTGLTPRQALTALSAFGVNGYTYISGPTASDVLAATDNGLVLTGVGYWAYPSIAQAEVGGKNDFGFGGPHAILVAGRRYWDTKPSFWGTGPFAAGWRFWGRDPDHSQGWHAGYDRARSSWLVRAMSGLIGSGSPPWQNTFMIAKGVTLRATQGAEPGFDQPIDQPTSTPDASGTVAVVAEPEMKTGMLGLLPAKNAPSLKLASFLTGVVPAHPAVADNLALVPAWILGGNDQYGDCGPVSIANMVLQVTTYLGTRPLVVSQADIFDLYRRSGNPDFDPATGAGDRGVDYQTMLEALLAGGIAGKKPVAFAQVDVGNLNEVRAAIAIFGGLGFGVQLEDAQKTQTPTGTWTYVPSAAWGGHAVLAGQYATQPPAPDQLGLISWAQEIEATDSFLSNELAQAWVVIWPEHLGSKQFQQGIDLAALQAAYKQLTGSDLAVQPGPVVPPTPKGAGCATAGAVVALAALALVRG